MSANDRPESASCVLQERGVELRWRQIENGVGGLVHAWDDERIDEATNAVGSPPTLDVVEDHVPEHVVQTLVRHSAAGELRKCRDVARRHEFAHDALVVIRPDAGHAKLKFNRG
jgi:hypothetical protein